MALCEHMSCARCRLHTARCFPDLYCLVAVYLDLAHFGSMLASCVELLPIVERTRCGLHVPRSSTCLGVLRASRHAPAAPTWRALPVAQGIRFALRLHALAPKVAGPKHRRRRLASLTPRGGSWRSFRLRAQTSRARPYRVPRVRPGRLDLFGVEEMPGEVGAQRGLEAAHGRQRCRLGPRL